MGFEPRLSVAIHYAPWVDWREENAKDQAARLEQSDYVNHVKLFPADEDVTSIWESIRPCWLWGAETDSTHHITVQGDVVLCENFGEAARNAIRTLPNRNISFYGTHKRLREEFESGGRWYRYNGGFWGQCACIPSPDIQDAIAFGDTYVEDDYGADDRRLSAWNELAQSEATWITTPQLAEHLGDEESARGSMPPSDWTAAIYVGDLDIDAADIIWSFDRESVPYYNSELKINTIPDRFEIEKLVEDGYIEATE